ncbi:Ser-Thr-rich glycosyl-phosphatidyl-inositol-anchored membrane family-domain-containing protein [Xylogone sp. PMI_703]|nr:Ser-Thr-rich glycosyl-phosphatidyl-inositol-anchored membrane family-domain-containing protein [Xylogone sp. PMI_703]
MRFSRFSLLGLAGLPLVIADVSITAPAAGASVPGGTTFTITWTDSNSAPSISDLTSYQIFLYSGSNAAPAQLYSLGQGTFANGNSFTATVPVGVGGTGTNAYFIGIMSTATAGGTITNFSNRFTMTGMTGTFSQAVKDALATVTGTAGPPAINNVAQAAPAPAPGTADGVFGTPYDEQLGPTRYAPMQPVPPTAITATNTAPLWPTSSVVLATTFLPIPSVQTTITQPQTFSIASHPNSASPAPQPMDDMQKFLNRWKD